MKSSDRLSQGLRLMTILILLGTMPVCSVYAQDGGTNGCTCSHTLNVTGGSGGNTNEGHANLFDSNPATKWCSTYIDGNGHTVSTYVTFEFTEAVVINSYTLTTAKDTEQYPSRNWTAWTISGSSDGSTWSAVDSKTGVQLPTQSGDTYTVTLENNTAQYSYYKLVVDGIVSGTVQQMADINFSFFDNGFCSSCHGYEEPFQVDGVYQIANAGNLYWFAALVNGTLKDENNNPIQDLYANAKLTADITVNEEVLVNGELNSDVSAFRSWTPIGTDNNKYSGTFDGNNKTISGLYYNGTDVSNVGLFGSIANATIKKLGVIDSYFNANGNVGGIVGSSNYSDAEVTNSYFKGYVVGANNVGGIVGNNVGELTNCYNTGSVSLSGSGSGSVGGVVGNNSRTVSNCYYLKEDDGVNSGIFGIGGTDTDGPNTVAKNYTQFASGEVAFLLNGPPTVGNLVWGQNINTEPKDAYPVLNGAKVYKICDEENSYSNTKPEGGVHSGLYDDNGFCTNCGAEQPATYNEAGGYYEIANAGNLYWFAAYVNAGNTSANAKLTANITVNQNVLVNGELNSDVSAFRSWTPIGTDNNKYSGTFDGDNHTISGLYYNNTTASTVGLFGNVANGSIMNVGVIDSYFKADISVGAIVGYFTSDPGIPVTVSNCYNTGICQGNRCVGGVVGYVTGAGVDDTKIINCYNTGSVRGYKQCGGIVGIFLASTIKNCFNTGNVTVDDNYKGAIIGHAYIVNALNCYYLSGPAIGYYNDGHTSTTDVLLKTSAQFASGEVAYLLNGSTSGGDLAWGQNIDNGQEVQFYPVLNGSTVYEVNCNCSSTKSVKAYSNYNEPLAHAYVNGFCTFCGAYQPAVLNNNGTENDSNDDYYEIANAGNLYWFAALVNGDKTIFGENAQAQPSANAKLTTNITVNQNVLVSVLNSNVSGFRTWTPIGYNNSLDDNKSYTGTFDGQGYTISGLYIDNNTNNNVSFKHIGLFGVTAKDGNVINTITNLGVIDSYFNVNKTVGGVVGSNSGSNITDCYFNGYVKLNTDEFGASAGGVVGINTGTVSNCYNMASVNGIYYVGGVVGSNDGTVSNCYNVASVTSNENTMNYVGGIVGNNTATISNCYNTGLVNSNGSGTNHVGGIVGNNTTTISNCYNTGLVNSNGSGTNYIGGIVGKNQNDLVSNCYYLSGTATKGIGNGGSDVEGQTASKTYAEFASGEVAYLLQNAQASQETVVWGQNITNVPKDAYPVLGGVKVYKIKETCQSEPMYSNTNTPTQHDYSNGFCTACGAYQPATYNELGYYYQIANAGNLYWFAGLVNGTLEDVTQNTSANAKLTTNITVNQNVLVDGVLNSDVSGFRPWTPIGNSSSKYSGTFDGDNYTISGLYYNNAEAYNVGLFGCVTDGFVQNVGVIDSYFNAYDNVGAIVGSFSKYNNVTPIVSNCYNTGVCLGHMYVGGVVGNCASTKITNCYNTGSVRGFDECGGIVGALLGSSEITNCFNTGYITVNHNYIKGAILAYYTGTPTISNCYYLQGTAANGVGHSNLSQEGTVAKTSAQFESGEVAYLLQNNATPAQTTQVWGQNIDNGQEREYYPVFSSARVYRIGEEDNYEYTNKIGGDVLWSYEEAVLTIYGSGSMIDFASNETKPWSNYLSNIFTVVVKAGITKIGANAFSDVNSGTEIILYGTEAPTLGTSCFKTSSNVYIPNFDWNINWYPTTVIPTYTSEGWKMPLAKSTEPSSEDHVAINAAMTISNSESLSVKSFGYCSDNVKITIEDGGQLTCEQAHGEVTVERTIEGYNPETTAKSQSSTKWYTISSPLKGNVTATTVTNLIPDDDYALYRYDEPSFTWENYKYQDNNFTTLDAGRGYLYANKNGVTLSFEGEINTEPVPYTLTAQGEELTGFHLIGNPFTHNITASNFQIDNTGNEGSVSLATGYYVLSNEGAWAAEPSAAGEIKPGQAALIKVDIEGSQQTNPILGLFPDTYLEYLEHIGSGTKGQEPRAKSQQPMLSLNVSNGNYSDRAFVIFGKGIGLDKINHQNEEIPVLYIPMSDADYAIAMMDENVSEIPVGFETNKMGEFTITLKHENCEFEELYLLDKETGAKVNILEEDYTFMATSGDNPDRFILVKSQGSQPEAQSNFAYINNGDVVIYGAEGNAQIDIYDVLGRHVYNTTGRDDVHIVSTDGYSAGVYVIRLMDEKGLRTQKVIID